MHGVEVQRRVAGRKSAVKRGHWIGWHVRSGHTHEECGQCVAHDSPDPSGERNHPLRFGPFHS